MARTHSTAANARYLADLSPKMSAGLVRCHVKAVPIKKNDHGNITASEGIAAVTITALIRHTLLEEGRDRKLRHVWRPTTNGLRVIRTGEPRLLAAASDAIYTLEPGKAMFPDAGEAIDDQTQRWYTADAHDRLQGLPGRREQALNTEAQNLSRRLRQGVRTADPHDVEVAVRLQRIREEIAALENLRRAA